MGHGRASGKSVVSSGPMGPVTTHNAECDCSASSTTRGKLKMAHAVQAHTLARLHFQCTYWGKTHNFASPTRRGGALLHLTNCVFITHASQPFNLHCGTHACLRRIAYCGVDLHKHLQFLTRQLRIHKLML